MKCDDDVPFFKHILHNYYKHGSTYIVIHFAGKTFTEIQFGEKQEQISI